MIKIKSKSVGKLLLNKLLSYTLTLKCNSRVLITYKIQCLNPCLLTITTYDDFWLLPDNRKSCLKTLVIKHGYWYWNFLIIQPPGCPHSVLSKLMASLTLPCGSSGPAHSPSQIVQNQIPHQSPHNHHHLHLHHHHHKSPGVVEVAFHHAYFPTKFILQGLRFIESPGAVMLSPAAGTLVPGTEIHWHSPGAVMSPAAGTLVLGTEIHWHSPGAVMLCPAVGTLVPGTEIHWHSWSCDVISCGWDSCSWDWDSLTLLELWCYILRLGLLFLGLRFIDTPGAVMLYPAVGTLVPGTEIHWHSWSCDVISCGWDSCSWDWDSLTLSWGCGVISCG